VAWLVHVDMADVVDDNVDDSVDEVMLGTMVNDDWSDDNRDDEVELVASVVAVTTGEGSLLTILAVVAFNEVVIDVDGDAVIEEG